MPSDSGERGKSMDNTPEERSITRYEAEIEGPRDFSTISFYQDDDGKWMKYDVHLTEKRAAEEAAEERGFQRGRVERLKSVLPRLHKARSIGYKWGYEDGEQAAAKKEMERCAKKAKWKASTIGIIHLYADGQADEAGQQIAAAIREGENG